MVKVAISLHNAADRLAHTRKHKLINYDQGYMNRNQKAFKKKHKSLEIPFKTIYYLDHQNDEQSPLVFFTAVDRLFMKPLLVCALGLQLLRLTWVSPVFYGRLEVNVETYPRKLTGPVHNTSTRTRARPENAMLLNQRHDENRKSLGTPATMQCTAK